MRKLTFLLIVLLSGCQTPAMAQLTPSTLDRLATAIYWAEGGPRTSHPYGILATYHHTTPRVACINTIKHQYRNWVRAGAPGHFIHYLASRYAPVGSNTDVGTNQYWERNVRRLYAAKS